jgi:TonB-dependent receptor
MTRTRLLRRSGRTNRHGLILAVGLALFLTLPVHAQQIGAQQIEEVVVTGYRGSLLNALAAKRDSAEMVDVIQAEDIAKFPDANLAESLQRLPGVSIDRDNGEGRSITVRGLGADFTTVRLNGMDALSTAGGNDSGSAPNRSRGFDFNTFASDLFSSLTVQKTASAATDEGSLGSTVDLNTGRPLDFGGRRIAWSADGAYYENGSHTNPVLAALASDTWFDNRLGALVSVAYAERDSTIDSYQRNPGVFDLNYRSSQHQGKTPRAFGFAQPGAGPGGTFGSDPTAYAQLNDTTIIPALGTLNHQELSYQRLGVTGTLQWRPLDHTTITTDYVLSSFQQKSVNYQLSTVGLNRNGTLAAAQNGTLPAAGTAAGNTARRAAYARCDQSATVDCGQTLNGTQRVAGTAFSFNPNNLDPFDYYNARVSPGFIADPNGLGNYTALIGRPGTQVKAAHVNEFNQADFLQLDNVDWRDAADGSDNDTDFNQLSINVDHEFNDRLRGHFLVGRSKSEFKSIGLLAEFNALDRDGFVYDERGGGNAPIFQLGFDPNDRSNFDLVKGFSTLRYFKRTVDNEFRTARLDFEFDVNDRLTLSAGGTGRRFEFENSEGRRNSNIEAINPTLQEAGLTIDQLGRQVSFGSGLNLPGGAPTMWFAPDLDKFIDNFGINCDCINKFGDFRGAADNRQANQVMEDDRSFYLQGSFNLEVFGRALRGNLGVRYAITNVDGSGVVGTTPVKGDNEYTDTLPSINLAYELAPNLLLRLGAAKTMSRPFLANLTPGSTAFSNNCTAVSATSLTCRADSIPGVTLGNPELKPFRSRNYDFGVEWYFARGAVLSGAYFRKEIGSFPQQVLLSAPLSTALDGPAYQQVLAALGSAATTANTTALFNYTMNGGTWAIRQFQDSPGGIIEGFELTYQQNFTFLPAPFNNFGVQLNYTDLDSELSYVINPDTHETAKGPFLNVSPQAFNATLFYETDRWDARISGAYRKAYVRTFPISTGSCAIGTTTGPNGGPCDNTPVFADFAGTDDTLNVDASIGVKISRSTKLSLEALNLTNQTTDRWNYGANHLVAQYGSTGRVFMFGVRATY